MMKSQIFRVILLQTVSFLNFGFTLLQQNCGTALSTRRIVGGYDLGYYKYPWFAALHYDGEAFCGGTLIGPGIVVSAAHCFRKYIKLKKPLQDMYKVKLGLYNNCATNEQYQKMYNVKKVHVHEKYWKFREKPYFDISILILDGDTSSYQPVCMPTAVHNSNTRGDEAFIQGLGDKKFDSGNYPCELREARVLIYRHKECKRMLRRHGDGGNIKHAFCAGYLEGGVDACQGDSGGPLVTMNNQNKYILLGITSTGFDCAIEGALGLYTDVSHYLGWIERKTGLQFQDNSTGGSNFINTTLIPNAFTNITEIKITIERETRKKIEDDKLK